MSHSDIYMYIYIFIYVFVIFFRIVSFKKVHKAFWQFVCEEFVQQLNLLNNYEHPEAEWCIYVSITRPSLVQIMTCCLLGTKPLSEPILICNQLDPKKKKSVKYWLKFIHFLSRKCIGKWRPFSLGLNVLRHVQPIHMISSHGQWPGIMIGRHLSTMSP